MFDTFVGNSFIKQSCAHLILQEKIPHFLLFSGPKGVGKKMFATLFAQQLLHQWSEGSYPSHLSHPDLKLYLPEGKACLHTMESMRELMEEIYLAPYIAKKRIFIIFEADRMSPYSGNALLKTLEEAPQHSIMILVTSHPTSILPTIHSRAVSFRFAPIAHEEISRFLIETKQCPPEQANQIALCSRGSIKRALSLLSGEYDRLRALLLVLLTRVPPISFQEIDQLVSQLAEEMQGQQELEEGEPKKKEKKEGGSNRKKMGKEVFLNSEERELSALEKEALEKRKEADSTAFLLDRVRYLLEEVEGWYRDLSLLKEQGDRTYLWHADWLSYLMQRVSHPFPDVSMVNALSKKCLLGIERYIPLKECLRDLFMKILF